MIYGAIAAAERLPAIGLGYIASAVSFDGADSNGLCIASQATTNSPLITASLWVRSSAVTGAPYIFSINGWSSGAQVGYQHSTDVGVFLNDTGSYDLDFGSLDGAFTDAVWHHLFISADTNHAADAKLHNLYLNGTDILTGNIYDTHPAFDIATNGKSFGIPNFNSAGLSTDNTTFEYADVWIAYGVCLEPSQITKFRSSIGKPVYLGESGEIPTGSAPTYFFSGGAAAFPINRGTGSTANVIGSITDASTHP